MICAVTFSSPVIVGHAVTITLTTSGDEGGQVWTVTYGDGGAGGSFSEPTGTIGDASSGQPTQISVTYTAPPTPKTVTFGFSDDGGSIDASQPMTYQFAPATLTVNAPATPPPSNRLSISVGMGL